MIKYVHVCIALLSIVIGALYLPDDIEFAIYNLLLAIVNMLFAIFWQIDANR